jgi:hypothetical protein
MLSFEFNLESITSLLAEEGRAIAIVEVKLDSVNKVVGD